MRIHPVSRCVLAVVAVIAAVGAVEATSLFVANNGVDSGTCGSGANPCRSINQAISNALDGDHIRVGPGRYSISTEPPQGGCACLIQVDKAVKIEAVEGAGGTILDGRGMIDTVVRITSDGVTLGLNRKGFTIRGGTGGGVVSEGNDDIEVHSNRVVNVGGSGFVLSGVRVLATYNEAHGNDIDGFRIPAGVVPNGLQVKLLGNQSVGNGSHGFLVQTGMVELESNLAAENADTGFVAAGTGLLFKFNAATGNLGGFASSGGSSHRYDRNVASGNATIGVILSGSGHTFEQNAVLGNNFEGIAVGTTSGILLTKNNIYGNDPTGNCGIRNLSGAPLSAIKNYWGAPGGPGADPADNVCGPLVTSSPWLSGPTLVPYLTGSGGS